MELDFVVVILICIMLVTGAVGGYLNYLHNFDTSGYNPNDVNNREKFVLLGICSAFLVPFFLGLIQSDLISMGNAEMNSIRYLEFAGFCLISSIFSKRFVTSIGEKALEILEDSKKVQQQTKASIVTAERKLISTEEDVRDLRSEINIKTAAAQLPRGLNEDDVINELHETMRDYVKVTTVPDYKERIELKGKLKRRMGEMIVNWNFDRDTLFNDLKVEGALVGLAYAIQLKPDEGSISLLRRILTSAKQLYTKYTALVALDSLLEGGYLGRDQALDFVELVQQLKVGADHGLLNKVADTIRLLAGARNIQAVEE